MSQPDLMHLPLSKLSISKLNMRHGRKAPDVSDILPSIREKGIRQTLLVRREGDGFGIVAGRRRFFALQQIAKEAGSDPLVPCAVMLEDDAASAIEASLIENVARLPASEMEQFAAFRKLHEEGRLVGDIAAFFGVTELHVRRVLALAALSAPIRKLYAEEDIDGETVRALTLATPEQQAAWLKLWNSETERAPTGRACRAWVTGGTAITTDKALFDLAGYTGAVTADLFGEAAVFADAAAFWEAQDAAMAAKIKGYRQRGWADVVVLERGAYFQRWDYVQTPKKQGGKVIVERRHDGTVTFHEGWLKAAEARKVRTAKAGGEAQTEANTRSEMSGPMTDYVGLHRHAAARASLIRSPAISLRLMAAHALCGSALWNVRLHSPSAVKEATLASVDGGAAAAELGAVREGVEALFDALDAPVPRQSGDAYHLCETFAALLAMSDAEVVQVIALTMAETLESGGPAAEAVLHACGTDLRAQWKPDAAFFDLLRDKRVVNAMVSDIGSPSLAEACAAETAKAQKEVLLNRIVGEGCKPDPYWRPGWMLVPPTRHLEGAACPPADAWDRIAGLFETDGGHESGAETSTCKATAA
ncbi:MAG: ParB/RepB/Spo0J family partition protein [Hyphomonas sp.]|uniref:ParB/RepB/Spo0J family partition protein n=1 Tax=Hyphomonas sp. TaxID=87 RepID=UPI00185471C5|nr:ParB/RepB/Spo0J family partition protein [Hyphomonas sp.]MBA3067826.1 ParB/RepB/Spo0J family partition protein [Hyphomonas sp.]MBU3919957.1 ParB/RepB/Spo0J family partition protein [Alphaproteobacteria bacterium]MBU4062382.1 ParB/RepB/Spo0J family partition protein [Alphaproteobacteria bacterium]MBU4166010.1 ParB/RepB/Spo0J family partition protein [Alphaproteobacteria bacterium]